jgi:hypothetical protein
MTMNNTELEEVIAALVVRKDALPDVGASLSGSSMRCAPATSGRSWTRAGVLLLLRRCQSRKGSCCSQTNQRPLPPNEVAHDVVARQAGEPMRPLNHIVDVNLNLGAVSCRRPAEFFPKKFSVRRAESRWGPPNFAGDRSMLCVLPRRGVGAHEAVAARAMKALAF